MINHIWNVIWKWPQKQGALEQQNTVTIFSKMQDHYHSCNQVSLASKT